MKPGSSHVFIVGVLLWGLLALALAGGLWWVLGVWPETPKAWIFILILSPILWLLIEVCSNVLVDFVDFILPKVRYVNRVVAERLAAQQGNQLGVAGVMQFMLYVARAGLVVFLLYLFWQWTEQQFELPDREGAMRALRSWWYHNFR